MRKLTKGTKPAILIANGVDWTNEYITDPAIGNSRRRWAHDEIVSALSGESFQKCMYCEDWPEPTSWLHVEHILPKSKFASLVVEWTNLGYACPKCNVSKGDYYDPAEPVLNPYADDPREHLEFCGGFVRAKDGSELGYMSIFKLDLLRDGLCQARMEEIENVEQLIRVWHLLPNPSAKDAIKEQIWAKTSAKCRFSATVADHLRHISFPK